MHLERRTRYGLTVDTVPAAEPVSTADAKTHLRVAIAADDSYIDALVKSSRMHVEELLQRVLITQTLKMSMDEFPPDILWLPVLSIRDADPALYLPRSPVQSVASVKYVDDQGTIQTLAASKYRVDTESLVPRITPAYGETWPTTRPITNAVEVLFVAGYGLAGSDVPAPIIHAIKLLIGTHYDPVRATVAMGAAMKLPDAADALLGPYRVATRAGSY